MTRKNLQLEPIRDLAHLATNLGKRAPDGSRTILRKDLPKETKIALERLIGRHPLSNIKNLRRIALLKSTRNVATGQTVYNVRLVFKGYSIYLAQFMGFAESEERPHDRRRYSFEFLERTIENQL